MIEQPAKLRSDLIEFNLVKVVHRVARGKWILLATTLLGLVIAYVVYKNTKPWYWSQAAFLPPHSADLSPATPSLLLLGGGGTATSDLYLGLLVTRSVQDDVVDHVGLKQIYHAPTQGIARYLLSKNTALGVGRNSLVFVNVKAENPELAAKIANAYLDALYRLNSSMVGSSSNARGEFYQQQLQKQKNELDKAEQAFKEEQEKTGIVLPQGEAQANLNATAGLDAQINDAEERLAGLLVSETEQNPQVVQARAQLAQLRAQLAQEVATQNAKQIGIPSANRLPGLTLEYQEKERELNRAQGAYDALLDQYGKARMSSIDPGPQLEVVDRAIPAEFKAGPDRNQYLEEGGGFGFLAGLFYLLFFDPSVRIFRSLIYAVQHGEE